MIRTELNIDMLYSNAPFSKSAQGYSSYFGAVVVVIIGIVARLNSLLLIWVKSGQCEWAIEFVRFSSLDCTRKYLNFFFKVNF